tara:strand:- start:1454 stop:1993 length:540 start_codon:yes stop_codon:yes gene_type:complete
MTTHAMIDIETLATTPEATILSVGGVKFNPYSNEEPHTFFDAKLDIDAQTELGRDVDQGTLEWWAKQPQHIQDIAFTDEGRTSLSDFTSSLNKWLVGCQEIWCQGPQFDMVIIENLYKQLGTHQNWAYWQIRDSRTVFSMMDVDPRKGIQEDLHSAVDDSKWQAKCLQTCFFMLNIKKD